MPTTKQHIAQMTGLITSIRGWSPREVFTDFVEMGAIALRNAVDHVGRAEREARYLKLSNKYKPEDQPRFADLLHMLTNALSENPSDVLGLMYMELGVSSADRGQFFTPPSISNLLAALTIDPDEIHNQIARRGFITLSEPASGSGAMIIAFANKMLELGINYQEHLHVTLVDLDIRACHMAYIQLTLLNVPAVVVHGNTLTLEEFSHWTTLSHHLNLFGPKLKRGFSLDSQLGAAYCAHGAATNESPPHPLLARADRRNTPSDQVIAL